MSSFLNKVFGRKKDDKPGSPRAHPNKRHSNASLLEGRYEAVSPSISPSADKFAERAQQAKDKDGAPSNPLSLFRSRSKNLTDPTRSSSTPSLATPHLTLNLPVPKEEKSRALGVVFEADPDNISTLPEIVLGERRLNPLETLLLVKACSDHIAQHGGEFSQLFLFAFSVTLPLLRVQARWLHDVESIMTISLRIWLTDTSPDPLWC